jgi:SAM-dependent methyltransferase
VVSDVAQLKSGDRVLDVACGTGVLARAAAERATPGGSVVGLDPNPGMLAIAAELAPAVEWRQGAAESLPFPDASFDAVVSQFGLMFFSDRRTALREMLRVLRPGGRLAVAVWDSLDHTPAYAAEVALLERVAGRAAADALRAPFVLGDRQVLTALFADAGMPGARIATVPGTAEFPSARTLVEADLRGWLPVMGVTLSEPAIARILEEADDVLRDCVTLEGTARFASPAHVVAATKP